MSGIFFILAGITAFAVIISLLLGVTVMARGGETGKKYGNKLMRARVILQGLTVLFFILGIVAS